MVFAILAYTSCLSCEFRISGQQPPFYKELPSCWHVIMWLTYKLYMNTIMESCSHWWIIGKIGSSSNDHQSLIANSFFHASTSIEWFDLKKSSFHHHFDHFEGFCQTNIKDFSFWWLSLLIACPFVKQVIFHQTFALFWTCFELYKQKYCKVMMICIEDANQVSRCFKQRKHQILFIYQSHLNLHSNYIGSNKGYNMGITF